MTREVTAAVANTALSITDDAAFGLEVTSGKGLVVTSGTTTTDISVDLDGDITAENNALEIDHDGTGSLTVTTGEDSVITSIGNGQAGSIDKNAGTDNRAGGSAIHLGTISGATDVTVTVNGDLGINTDAGRLYYNGIQFVQSGTGNTNVTVNGDIFGGYNARGTLISSNNTNAGAMTLTLNGNVNILNNQSFARAFGGTHIGRGLLDITIGSGATITGQGRVLGNGGRGGTRITVDGTINITHASHAAVYSRPESNNGVETEIDINNTVSGHIGVRMNNAGSAA
ncbi:MAG: hypothetical protein OXF19_03170, partial [Hyphomicrobiales bacterium]|nr:hypothetical protein [Hyphomicrobiales bacterium]